VIAGPDPEIHGVVRWRCVDLQAELARRFHVKVHTSTIAKWLHQLDLTRLQPRPATPGKNRKPRRHLKKLCRSDGLCLARPSQERAHQPCRRSVDKRSIM
jgi:hypothetical protein